MNVERKHKSEIASSDLVTRPHSEDNIHECPCSQCHYVNDANVAFCAECGQSLQKKTPCPFCGILMHGKQNICEFCGEWLLEAVDGD